MMENISKVSWLANITYSTKYEVIKNHYFNVPLIMIAVTIRKTKQLKILDSKHTNIFINFNIGSEEDIGDYRIQVSQFLITGNNC